jgi:hypothetical protein
MVSVEQDLLRLVAAIRGGGGESLRRTLTEILVAAAPFDRAEIAFLREGGIVRWGLGGTAAPVAGDDLVRHVAAHPVSVRLDHIEEAEPFPATQERMRAQGQLSLLALPITTEGGIEGAIVLARDYGWAFAGASLRRLRPIALMTGLLLDVTQQLRGRRRR